MESINIIICSKKDSTIGKLSKLLNKAQSISHFYNFQSCSSTHLLDNYIQTSCKDITYVILDIESFWHRKKKKKRPITPEEEKENEQYIAAFTAIILSNPEVTFLFYDEKLEGDSYKKTLFAGQTNFCKCLSPYDVCIGKSNFIEKKGLDIVAFFKEKNNLYDWTRLRLCLKRKRLNHLKLHENFGNVIQSRLNNLAVNVEEETDQNFLNSYILYANGYRVKTISSAVDLYQYNKSAEQDDRNCMIIRDCDLQFHDEKDAKEIIIKDIKDDANISQQQKDELLDKLDEDIIHLIRGYICSEDSINCTLDAENPFWKNIYNPEMNNMYFISNSSQFDFNPIKKSILPNIHNAILPGLKKPINSIYYKIQEIATVRDVFNRSRDLDKIVVHRDNNDHSVPLDVYGIARELYNNAKNYYMNKQYILSALLSREAIEISNGIHFTLLTEAYHLLCTSENALAMNSIGGSEIELCKDSEFRVKMIREDIQRFYLSRANGHTPEKNTLVQIFSDCRQYCHEKEHFQSEEVFIDAMAKINDGGPFPIYKKTKQLLNQLVKFSL